MHSRHTTIALFGVLVSLLSANPGSAQEPPVYGSPAYDPVAVGVSDQRMEAISADYGTDLPVTSECSGKRGWLFKRGGGCAAKGTGNRPLLNSHGLGCYAHHDQIGCSSLHSELRFIFGSCRTFFGEPCNRGPYRIPLPDAGYPPSGTTPTDVYNPPNRYQPYGSQPYYTTTLTNQ